MIMTRQLAVVFTIVLAITPLLSGCTSAARFRAFHSGKAYYRVAHKQMREGDSYEEVASLLGPGQRMGDKHRGRMIRAATKRPDLFTDGVKDTDVFFLYQYTERYRINGRLRKRPLGMPMQFRDRKLVNFNPEYFKTYKPPTMGETVGR
jgi:hypothetical protein